MKTLAIIMTSLVAVLHFGFMGLEMFFWDHPVGRDVFSMTAEESASSAVLAANQGLYNGFLAVGLLWGLIAKKRDVVMFFLLFIIVAGAYGAMTAKPTIIFTQSLPALIALALTLFSKPRTLL